MIREFLSKHGDYSSDKSFKQLTTIKMGGEIAHYIEPLLLNELIKTIIIGITQAKLVRVRIIVIIQAFIFSLFKEDSFFIIVEPPCF